MAGTAPARQWNYPPAPRGDVVDIYHGVPVADPYRWLEDLDSPRTRAWVEEENALAFGVLRSLPRRAGLRDRLARLWNYPRYGLPFKEGGLTFFTRNNGLQNQAVFCVQSPSDAAPRVLLDPNTLSADGTVALASAAVSHDGARLAYATAAAGSDWNEIRVRDVATGADAPDLIRWVKFSEPSWTRDGRGFFYSRFPEPKSAPGTRETFGELSHETVYYHLLGSPQGRDRPVFAMPDEPKWFVNADATEDGRYAVITIGRGDSDNNLLRVADLGDPLAPRVDAPGTAVVDAWNAEYGVIGNEGPVLFVKTNLGAPRGRIIAIDLRDPRPALWRTVVPEGPDAIDSAALAGGRLVVLTMHDASSRLRIWGTDGRPAGTIPLPDLGAVTGLSGKEDDPELFYAFTSFTHPTTNYRHNLATGRSAAFNPPAVAFDPAAYETTQVFYRSRDGTRVPMFIVGKKGLRRDGTTPTLLYGYGGFEISMMPAFSVANLVWLENGGFYAMPNLRGGGEYGKAWHEAGKKERKQNVFDDFIAAAEWLFAHRYTSPSRLVISGGSNGGLLIGATLNQRPDLCRVALPAVGVMDMLRFQKFTIGYAWVSDYGSSDDPAGFAYLRAYSPLHTMRPGAAYPAVLVTTGDHDDRVFPAHSFKYAAALQASAADGPGALPVLIRIETREGHGAGKPLSRQIDEAADRLAFAIHFLGLD
jgi:prolyl oligopeptidase